MRKIETLEELELFLKDYEELKEIGRTLHTFHMIIFYFGELNKKQQKKLKKLEKKAKEIAKKWGFSVVISSDSRENPIQLVDKDQPAMRLVIPL